MKSENQDNCSFCGKHKDQVAKLIVGAADAPYEREADLMAGIVISMPEVGHQGTTTDGGTPVQRQSPEDGEILQGKS